MGELLLISDDLRRTERLARDITDTRALHIHDLYDEALPEARPELIVGDVRTLDSDAIQRLRRILQRVRAADVPLLCLLHDDSPRTHAKVTALGASGTVSAAAAARRLAAAVEGLSPRPAPASAPASPAAIRHAGEARRFLCEIFTPDRPIVPATIETGTDLVGRAILEAGIRDWIAAVRRFDDATHQHCLLVAGVAAAFSGALGLGPAARHRLTKAALLHDVGKTHIPTAILNKPAPLDDAERAVMRTHAALGHAMLVGQGFEDDMLAVVRSHHEMLDGSGYPDGLKGAEIPDLVRLVTICDIYVALIERRPYRAPMPPERAYGIVAGMRGRLDDDLVRAFRPIAVASGEGPSPAAD